jgi:hypothetical protein
MQLAPPSGGRTIIASFGLIFASLSLVIASKGE